MRNVLLLLLIFAVSFLIAACATIEPDDGRHLTPPTFHWHDYTPKTSLDFDMNISGDTIKISLDRSR